MLYEGVPWTITDLELLPDNGNHYEIINGELFVIRAPHWKHQKACNNICTELTLWSRKTGLGEDRYRRKNQENDYNIQGEI